MILAMPLPFFADEDGSDAGGVDDVEDGIVGVGFRMARPFPLVLVGFSRHFKLRLGLIFIGRKFATYI
jgi:hypothetical protein